VWDDHSVRQGRGDSDWAAHADPGRFMKSRECGCVEECFAMAMGRIKKLVQEKGFGFIATKEGNDVFFHHSTVANRAFESLTEGQQVEFQIDPEPSNKGKGPRASSVTPVG
jgi:CspA family cold shock protein